MNRFEDYKTTTNLLTNSAINRLALEKLNTEDCEFKVGDMAFFIDKRQKLVVGKVVKTKMNAVVLNVEGSRWLVPTSMLSMY